jgi:GNAT superfamily N-acetyltransferase
MSGPLAPLEASEPLGAAHDLSAFDCGAPELDEWLRRRALANQESGASRSYVACAGREVVGYYCLATGAVSHAEATGRVRRNMPDPIPVMVLGRLAVDRRWQGRGVGRALLRDAVLRTVQAADIAGIRALLVHAKSPEAKKFYEACGFGASPLAPMTLMITIADAKRGIES